MQPCPEQYALTESALKPPPPLAPVPLALEEQSDRVFPLSPVSRMDMQDTRLVAIKVQAKALPIDFDLDKVCPHSGTVAFLDAQQPYMSHRTGLSMAI